MVGRSPCAWRSFASHAATVRLTVAAEMLRLVAGMRPTAHLRGMEAEWFAGLTR